MSPLFASGFGHHWPEVIANGGIEPDTELVPSGNPPRRGELDPLNGAKSKGVLYKGLLKGSRAWMTQVS